jgi:hypothetical protein
LFLKAAMDCSILVSVVFLMSAMVMGFSSSERA